MVKLLKKAVKWYLRQSADCPTYWTPSCMIPVSTVKKAA